MFCCPACMRPRRAFLAADAPEGAAAAVATGPTRWIDVHCHIFNGRDLPMRHFIDLTHLKLPIERFLWPLVAIMAGGTLSQSPTAQAELDELRRGELGAAIESPDTATALRAIADSGSHGHSIVRNAINVVEGAVEPANARITDADFAQLARYVEGSSGWFHVLEWAAGFSERRNRMVQSLLAQFRHDDPVMVTPALVDYNRWLGIKSGCADETNMSSISQQLSVMEEIGRLRAKEDGKLLFSFAPFDPWRYLEDRGKRPTVIDIADEFIQRGSVIGFKVYPPMGFAPAFNAERGIDSFPQELRRLVGDHPGAALDEAMEELFQYCLRNDVPIMAHCADSNFPVDGQWSHPKWWKAALDQDGHANLRVNLGHFGGIWDFGAAARPNASADDRTAQDCARNWATAATEMTTDRYPNLYADIAFADILLRVASDPEAAAACEFMDGLIGSHASLKKRLMYGSDWIMVGMADHGDSYASSIGTSLRHLFPTDAIEDIRWRNAARYLGLGRDDRTRDRLTKFLRDNGADVTLLDGFDPG